MGLCVTAKVLCSFLCMDLTHLGGSHTLGWFLPAGRRGHSSGLSQQVWGLAPLPVPMTEGVLGWLLG